jgi:chromosome segregation ATPase
VRFWLERFSEKPHNPAKGLRLSDNPTRETPDSRSFEERVFARFDALDTRMDRHESRLTTLEHKVDAHLRETRPIWEAMQTNLESIKGEVKDINRGMKILHKDILDVRVDQDELRERVEKLESEPTR